MPVLTNRNTAAKTNTVNIVFTNQQQANIMDTKFELDDVTNSYKNWISNNDTLGILIDQDVKDYTYLFELFEDFVCGGINQKDELMLVGLMNELSFSSQSSGLNKWLMNQWAAKFSAPLPSSNVLYVYDDITQAIVDFKNNPSALAMTNIIWNLNCVVNGVNVPYASFLTIETGGKDICDTVIQCLNASPNKSAASDEFIGFFSGNKKFKHLDLLSGVSRDVVLDIQEGAKALGIECYIDILNIANAFTDAYNLYFLSKDEIISHSHSPQALTEKYSETYCDDIVTDAELKLIKQVSAEEMARDNIRSAANSSGTDFKAKSLTLSGITYDTYDSKSYYASVYRKLVRLLLSGKIAKNTFTRMPIVKKSYAYDNRRGDVDKKGKHKAKTNITELIVYLDTSGSVREEDYYDGLVMLFNFCRKYKIQFKLRCFSTRLSEMRAVSYTSKNRFKAMLTEIAPGGGTDFDVVYRDAADHPQAVCVLFSDMEDTPSYSSPDLPKNLYFLPYFTCLEGSVYYLNEIFQHYIAQQTITADHIKSNLLGLNALVTSVDN